MKDLDEYDIRQSFAALDQGKEGFITLQDFHTLYLGLGFQPLRMTIEELRDKVDANGFSDHTKIPLNAVLTILSEHSRNRSEEFESVFSLLSQEKGYIAPEDLVRLSREAGEEISEKEAKQMASFFSSKNGRIDKEDFCRIFSPKDP